MMCSFPSSSFIKCTVHVLLLDRCTRPAEKRGTAHADLLVGAQVLADQCKQSAGDSIWVSAQSFCNIPSYFIVIDERCDPLCCDGSGRAGPELWVACCPQLLPFLCVINLTASSRICQNENRILVAVFIPPPPPRRIMRDGIKPYVLRKALNHQANSLGVFNAK